MKPVAILLFVFHFAIIVTIANAQETTPAKRRTPTLTTDDVQYGKSSKVVEEPVETTDTVPNSGKNSATTVDPRTVLTRAFAKLAGVKSLRTRLSISRGQSVDFESVIETVRPNRMHLTNAQMEMYVIGSTSYSKESGGEWKKTDLGSGKKDDLNELFNPVDLIDKMFATPGVKFSGQVIGKAVLDSTPTTVYEIIGLDNKGEKGIIRAWLGESDQLPRKMEISSADNQINLSFRFSDFNANFSIQPPTMQ